MYNVKGYFINILFFSDDIGNVKFCVVVVWKYDVICIFIWCYYVSGKVVIVKGIVDDLGFCICVECFSFWDIVFGNS